MTELKMAVLGDSVAWGQGLLDKHKYAYLVSSQICGQQPIMQAHSGAKIGFGYTGKQTKADPEVPEPVPTILAQVDQVPEPAIIDLVLIDGGINDVGVQTILNPFTRNSSLNLETTDACYKNMKFLLSKAVGIFTKPTCRFVITGYYPILSSKSDMDLMEADYLDRLLGLHGLCIPSHLERISVIKHIISLTEQFWHDSEKALLQAVSEIGLGKRMMFAQSPFTEKNALFASEPWLFGFNPDLAPEDEVITLRGGACDAQYPDPLDLVQCEMCHYASIGHPNIIGAEAISTAILNCLNV